MAERTTTDYERQMDVIYPDGDHTEWTENPSERCNHGIEHIWFEVPCCGGEFTCTDSNTLYFCSTCKTFWHDW